jgi:hypothetical protein
MEEDGRRSRSIDLEGALAGVLAPATNDKRPLANPKGWIEERAQEGARLVVLGDFNRRINIAGDDVWADLDDGDPDLTKLTEGLTSACLNFRFPEYIDHIVNRHPGGRAGAAGQLRTGAVHGGRRR